MPPQRRPCESRDPYPPELSETDWGDLECRFSGPDPRADLQWIFVAAYFLSNFEAVMDRIEAELPALGARGAAERPKPDDTPPARGG
jgi:hypothetical protein